MTLWDLAKDDVAIIESIQTENMDPDIALRLQELGFLPQRRITCRGQSYLGAPKIYALADSVIGLSSEIAQQISLKTRQHP